MTSTQLSKIAQLESLACVTGSDSVFFTQMIFETRKFLNENFMKEEIELELEEFIKENYDY